MGREKERGREREGGRKNYIDITSIGGVPKTVLPDGTSAAALPPFCCVLCLCCARCCLLRTSADPTCVGSPPGPSLPLGTASALPA